MDASVSASSVHVAVDVRVDSRATAADADLSVRMDAIEADYLDSADQNLLQESVDQLSVRLVTVEDDYLTSGDRALLEADLTTLGDRLTIVEADYLVAASLGGYATEASEALVRFGFDEMGVNRIQARHMVRNPASGRVMQKLGMEFEGILRGYSFNRGQFEDIAVYSILASDR